MSDITPEQRANLAKLAAYLRALPPEYPDFAMRSFTNDDDGAGCDLAHAPECGTAACACGHGPAAGVAPRHDESWLRYSYRVFIDGDNWDAWQWCFSGRWSRTDNTAHGAAARIEWLLECGLPENANEQRRGTAPLCYQTTPGAPQ